ncbi:hypothetical protein KEJ32_02515 [Candidatus Bathyarchaeota archaeon]|nr:hypothetical protein [Candidatus Bathyarchaeota archaeon]
MLIAAGALLTGALTTIFTGSFIAGLAMAGLTAAMYFFAPKPKTALKKPASLADFKISQVQEGAPVPIVYGTVTIPGTITYYGNLKVEEVKQKARGGKGGGGSKEVTTGYRYYIDMWQVIAEGKIELLDVYLDNDETKKPSYSAQIFNDGTQDMYPTELELANRLKGVAHIYWRGFFVGENRTHVPTVYFKVKRVLNTGLPHENLNNGSNPAAVVYELLTKYGNIPVSDINLQSFISASQYYAQKGWGINYVITSTREIRDVINEILIAVDSFLDYDEQGRITIKILRKEDVKIATIEDDFIEFSLAKQAWNTLPNHFVATCVENGVEKALILENQAAKLYAQQIIRKEYDLTMFDFNTAASRLADIMKRESYPKMTLNVKVPIRWAWLRVGDVVEIKNTELGLRGEFRVVSVSEPKFTDNDVELTLLQHTGAIFDSHYTMPPASVWTPPPKTLQNFTRIRVIELDYDELPRYLVLVNREVGYEEGYAVFISYDNQTYNYLTTLTTFSVAGTIQNTYPDNTYDIDDDVGVIFRPYKLFEDMPLSVSRKNLFTEQRLLVINNELMLFQNVAPYGDTDYRITGIVRGVLHTTKATHNTNSQAFIAPIYNNILTIDATSTFYLKLVPVGRGQVGDISQAQVITITPQLRSRTPKPISRIRAFRQGSNVYIDVHVKDKRGAGVLNADAYTDTYPFDFDGTLYISLDGVNWEVKDTANFVINNSNAFTLRVKHFKDGRYSQERSIYIPTTDGEYVVN